MFFMKLYFISGNKNKYEEVREILDEHNVEQVVIDIDEIQEIDAHKIIENKLSQAGKKYGIGKTFIVEDTSLYLDCLNGLPGPLIKWFLQTIGNEGLFDIAKRYNNFKAEAKTIIGFSKGDGDNLFFEGKIKGNICSPKLKSKFGWDPIFIPNGKDKSFAEMSKKEKNEISMRRIALEKLKTFLNKPTNNP